MRPSGIFVIQVIQKLVYFLNEPDSFGVMISVNPDLNSKTILFVFISIILYSSGNAETILLKNGSYLKGKVIGQDPANLTVQLKKGGTREIPKNSVLKVVIKDVSDGELTKIHEEELRILKEKTEKEEEIARVEKKRKDDERIRKEKEFLSAGPSSLSTSNYFYSPSQRNITLAGPDAECTPFNQQKQWFILFGTIPLTKPKAGDLFAEDASYRVYMKATGIDIFGSITLGILSSVTVKTLFVEKCNSPKPAQVDPEAVSENK